ncbi:cation:proton antiporter [Arcticibacterium luteifluviistationis]|uniref:Sodium:proton antiporter n=1 Tax=Arcticibacterium luteifluviistationis TaxID=1784714 RepID=A0A2Z4GCF8_9BACT|nr:sodium:proton antiporter [Arcticibacterium luteifluviistationis]AWV98982.1 sodium:proton antiporter [Arcticibacterium luteifluviistationis]
MELFKILTMLVVISALFGYINVRFLKLPTTIGLMVMALVFSLIMILLQFVYPDLIHYARDLMAEIDFTTVLMDVMLSFLLFAGALHTNVGMIKQEKGTIGMFALVGVFVSTFLIGGAVYYLSMALGLHTDLVYCLLFGALISPTDPIAVLGIMTKANVPKKIEINIVGESLFNDGVGVVIFFTILEIARLGVDNVTVMDVATLFVQEAIGGILFGLGLGFLMFKLLKSIDDYEVEVMITLALVMGGYFLAQQLHTSGPLAMVVAGLFMGSSGLKQDAMSETTELYVDKFWELVDVLMNAVLFVLIGLEILILEFHTNYFIAGAAAIVIVLLSRYLIITVLLKFSKNWVAVDKAPLLLTWGGLRGGLSIAMALSLPAEWEAKPYIVFITYCVVLFSIIVQGLTLEKLVKRIYKA